MVEGVHWFYSGATSDEAAIQEALANGFTFHSREQMELLDRGVSEARAKALQKIGG